jgi:hypothetical protein
VPKMEGGDEADDDEVVGESRIFLYVGKGPSTRLGTGFSARNGVNGRA